MKTLKLKQVELAVLSALVRDEIERTVREQREEMQEVMTRMPRTLSSPPGHEPALDYYSQRLHMLHQLKATLDRDDEGGDDGA